MDSGPDRERALTVQCAEWMAYAQDWKARYEALEAWAIRMPDAGLTDDDPRRAWWFERPRWDSNLKNDSDSSKA